MQEMIKKFGLKYCESIHAPMKLTSQLHKDPSGKSIYSRKFYGMIRSLVFFTASRLNIMFIVCLYAYF